MVQRDGDPRGKTRSSDRTLTVARLGLFLACMAALAVGVVAQEKDPNARAEAKSDSATTKPATAQGKIVAELDNEILYILHAKNGDTWFGSKGCGVYRYDGKTLVNFTQKDGLPSDHVGGMQEDKSGNIYITTNLDVDVTVERNAQCISRFDGETFRTLPLPKLPEPTSAWRINPDDLWFSGGQDSGCVYRYDGEVMHRLEFPPTKDGDAFHAKYPRSEYPNIHFSPYDVYVIRKDKLGNLWFGTSLLGVCRFDGKTFAWIPETELRHGSFGTRSIVEDKDGRFWFCDSLHRYVVDSSQKGGPTFKKEDGIRESKDPGRPRIGGIISAVAGDDEALWMATYGDGVWRYDGKDVVRYAVTVEGQDINLHFISKDRHGVMWLGTQSSGAYRFNGKAFEKFRP